MTQGRKRTYTGVVDCFRKVLADEGPSAFLKVHLLVFNFLSSHAELAEPLGILCQPCHRAPCSGVLH